MTKKELLVTIKQRILSLLEDRDYILISRVYMDIDIWRKHYLQPVEYLKIVSVTQKENYEFTVEFQTESFKVIVGFNNKDTLKKLMIFAAFLQIEINEGDDSNE